MKTPKPRRIDKKRKEGLVFVISGPSGSGKTTLVREFLGAQGPHNKKVARSISLTTRPKRSGERQGRDYFFVTDKQFRQQRRGKKILEWTEYLGYYYGTPKDYFEGQLKKGRHLILCLDLRGALKIKRLYPLNARTIFVMPPSLGVLRDRIEKRCNKTKQAEIEKRLNLAREEIRLAVKYDHCLVNRRLGQSVQELQRIIFAEIAKHSGKGADRL